MPIFFVCCSWLRLCSKGRALSSRDSVAHKAPNVVLSFLEKLATLVCDLVTLLPSDWPHTRK